MKKLMLLIMFVFEINSVYSQQTDYFKEGVDFTALGTEPFWNVRIDAEKGIHFDALGYDFIVETGVPIFIPIMDAAGFNYTGESERYSVQVQILKGNCSDGMSENVYPYSVKVAISDKVNSEKYDFIGCGSYTSDYRLNDVWVLETLKGKEINKDMYLNNRPYLEFNLAENRIGGSAGCNRLFGKIEVMNSKIVFGNNIGLTMMACPDMSLEREFIETITTKTLDYKIDVGRLYFYENGIEVLKFKKAD